MEHAKRHGALVPTNIKLYSTIDEKALIDDYFTVHPALKRGETVKQWILQAIQAETRKELGESETGRGGISND